MPLTEAFGVGRLLIDENLGGNDVAKWSKKCCQIRIGKIARKVVDEQICAVWT